MIDPAEVERLGTALTQAVACYSVRELRQILAFAYDHRVKGGSMRRLAELLEEYAVLIRTPVTQRSRRPLKPSSAAPDGNR